MLVPLLIEADCSVGYVIDSVVRYERGDRV